MDEIDSIGSARMESGNGNGDSEVQRTMLELLNQLDGFEATNQIKVWDAPLAQARPDAVAGSFMSWRLGAGWTVRFVPVSFGASGMPLHMAPGPHGHQSHRHPGHGTPASWPH